MKALIGMLLTVALAGGISNQADAQCKKGKHIVKHTTVHHKMVGSKTAYSGHNGMYCVCHQATARKAMGKMHTGSFAGQRKSSKIKTDMSSRPTDTISGGSWSGSGVNNGSMNSGSGTRSNGTMNNGTRSNGTFDNATMNNGSQNGGTFNNGTINNGSMNHGTDTFGNHLYNGSDTVNTQGWKGRMNPGWQNGRIINNGVDTPMNRRYDDNFYDRGLDNRELNNGPRK